MMRSLCMMAGVKYLRYHALRHLDASILDNANVNIGSIQRILGHENRITTEIYLHSIGEAESEAMRICKRVTGNSHTKQAQLRSLTTSDKITFESCRGHQQIQAPKETSCHLLPSFCQYIFYARCLSIMFTLCIRLRKVSESC